MLDRDLWREIFQSMNKNRTRTLLSGFTVAFAILLFTLLFGISNGLEKTFAKEFNDDAMNSIKLLGGKATKPFKGYKSGRRIQLTNKEFDLVEKEGGSRIEYMTSRLYSGFSVSYKKQQNFYDVRSVHPDHEYVEKTIMTKGRYINQNDIKNQTKVIVIGRLVVDDLFIGEDPIGKRLTLGGVSFKIVGVFEDEGGEYEERIIYMPITTAQQVYSSENNIDTIILTYDKSLSFEESEAMEKQLVAQLKQKLNVSPTDQRGVRSRNRGESMKQVSMMSSVIGGVIVLIGMGTLVAGIVGIANIMIFVVKERTKELGVRKALGAQPSSIVWLIMIEAILVTAIAGYVGLILGVGILELVGDSLEDYFITDPSVEPNIIVGATIILVLSGAFAGYIPAKRASKIKPIVALRDE